MGCGIQSVGHCVSSAQSSSANTTGVEMTEDEKNQAAAYIKLHDDVRQLIVDTINKELQNYSSSVYSAIRAHTMHHSEFETRVRDVIKNQMNKY